MKNSYADYLLKKTKDDYNKIADKFSSTRRFLSADIIALKEYLPENGQILDLGCGNGRFWEIAKQKNLKYIGADVSEKMVEIAKDKYLDGTFVKLDDFVNLPFPAEKFDVVANLAVLHHIPGQEYRLKFLKEIKRVMKKGGTLILTVWDMARNEKAKKLRIQFYLRKIISSSPLDWNDILYPFNTSKITVERYLHIFSVAELTKLLDQAGFEIDNIIQIPRGERGRFWNIQAVVKK